MLSIYRFKLLFLLKEGEGGLTNRFLDREIYRHLPLLKGTYDPKMLLKYLIKKSGGGEEKFNESAHFDESRIIFQY